MKQPFIYKYRPKIFEDFELDKSFVELINAFLEMNNLNILFIGNQGCGKTTLINCIIKKYYNISELNNITENIMTINSLKDQGISFYRTDVKAFCQTMCTIPNKKKIVILDDLDTLTEQSQQVFRNYMDKYDYNVNFIGTCSNIQKVIDSLQSRVTILKISVLNSTSIKKIINKICLTEKISLTDDAIEFIIMLSNNSIKMIINYLEKFNLISKNINYDIAINVCTNISFNELIKYTEMCKYPNQLNMAIHLIYSIYDQGFSVVDIFDNYFQFIKVTNIVTEIQKYEIIKLLLQYITIFYNIHEDEIELAFFTNNMIRILV